MRWVRLVNISQKSVFSGDAWKCWDSEPAQSLSTKKSRRLSGGEFQVDGPATAKHRRPLLSSRYGGTIIFRWLADRMTGVDDWRRRLFVCNCSSELFHEDIGTPARRAWIRSVTSSQWNSSCSSRDKPSSNYRVLLTTRAAEFITRCNLSVVTFGDPVITVALQ